MRSRLPRGYRTEMVRRIRAATDTASRLRDLGIPARVLGSAVVVSTDFPISVREEFRARLGGPVFCTAESARAGHDGVQIERRLVSSWEAFDG